MKRMGHGAWVVAAMVLLASGCAGVKIGDGKIGDVPVADARARSGQLLAKAGPLIELAAAGNPQAAAAVSMLLPKADAGSPAGATTNWVEILPDRTERVITNPVYRMVIAPPIVTPIANVAAPIPSPHLPIPPVPPAGTTQPDSSPGTPPPGGGATSSDIEGL